MIQERKNEEGGELNDISFEGVLESLKFHGGNTSEKGTLFEKFCKKVLETAPFFSDDVKKVWLWKDFPGNGNRHDNGIDLVVLDKDLEFWAIQAKFYDYDLSVSKKDIDSFVSASLREFEFEGKSYHFKQRILFSTTEKVSRNAQELFVFFGPSDLEQCGIDWNVFSIEDIEKTIVPSPKKKLKKHQEEALNDVLNGFEIHDRGRLVMACGTGKTFTSLKIVEAYIEKHHVSGANILYLVPSITLLSQTILEWKAQLGAKSGCNMFGICSDSTAGDAKKIQNAEELTVDMPISATTDVTLLSQSFNKIMRGNTPNRIHFFFSTYQSIDVIHEFQRKTGVVFDLSICDEAHRTIGAYKDEEEKTDFTKIHDSQYIISKKRLYMTATEKIYSQSAKNAASESGWNVFSMDDESIYGPVFHYLSFGNAVSLGLLTDYRLIVLTVGKNNITSLRLSGSLSMNLDLSAKIVGTLSALSKINSSESPDEFSSDPNPMKRAVAFCSTIEQADEVQACYNKLSSKSCLGLDYMRSMGYVIPKAKLITGEDKTDVKKKLLKWLREPVENGECRILTNARCLSEGVDVPSLDAVIFMAKKRSQVDIIQAVGRVMRKFGAGAEKKYGYIIIPVVVDDARAANETLSNNDDYKVVWQVVQALRSHDERFDAQINEINSSNKLPPSICQVNAFVPPRAKNGVPVGTLRKGKEGDDTDCPDSFSGIQDFPIPTDEELKQREGVFSAQLVKRCGNRLYWDDWSKKISEVTENVSCIIRKGIEDPLLYKEFQLFCGGLRELINPCISEEECINMLSEHIVTLPVLKTLFLNHDLIDQNPVSRIMECFVQKINGLEVETSKLDDVYKSVTLAAQGITSSEGRQEVIRTLFEKFFQFALPKSADKFGIVYTPVPIVDFIINSVSWAIQKEFNLELKNPGVSILDPFTGTGTFVTRLLSLLAENGASTIELTEKYKDGIWCNEIMLLAYYISLINIENSYSQLTNTYLPFEHAVLTDTFERCLEKEKVNYSIPDNSDFSVASYMAYEEDAKDVSVIIGNPPYSVGQSNANDNNKNDTYDILDKRISETYLKGVNSNNKKSIYDSYVRAFRWSSDRIGRNGIISFVSNGSYIDNAAFSGFRRTLIEEFNHIYIFNLRGNQRTMGELSRKEGGKIFGSGSRNTICIILLIKHDLEKKDGYIHYKDIGDYLSREQKLEIISQYHDISQIEWEQIFPDKNNDWINKKDENYASFILLGDKKDPRKTIFGDCYSSGIQTGRDLWVYSFSKEQLIQRVNSMIDFYNSEVDRCEKIVSQYPQKQRLALLEENKCFKKDKIKWTSSLDTKFSQLKKATISSDYRVVEYRPFEKRVLYYDSFFIHRPSNWKSIFKNKKHNLIINVSTKSKKDFSALMTDCIADTDMLEHTQSFPLYWYDTPYNSDVVSDDFFTITDYTQNLFEKKYGKAISKEAIFFYVYGVLYSPAYREKYSNDLAKDLPRIPFLAGFETYESVGRSLSELHIHYEDAPMYEGLNIQSKQNNFFVSKIRFLSKERKDTILFNDSISISGIPLEAYEFKVNGRSPIEWVMDQYQYSVDADTNILSDPNSYSEEGKGKYVFRLILSLITVALETKRFVDSLPEYQEI